MCGRWALYSVLGTCFQAVSCHNPFPLFFPSNNRHRHHPNLPPHVFIRFGLLIPLDFLNFFFSISHFFYALFVFLRPPSPATSSPGLFIFTCPPLLDQKTRLRTSVNTFFNPAEERGREEKSKRVNLGTNPGSRQLDSLSAVSSTQILVPNGYSLNVTLRLRTRGLSIFLFFFNFYGYPPGSQAFTSLVPSVQGLTCGGEPKAKSTLSSSFYHLTSPRAAPVLPLRSWHSLPLLCSQAHYSPETPPPPAPPALGRRVSYKSLTLP